MTVHGLHDYHFSRWKERQYFDEASKHVPSEKVAEVVHVSPEFIAAFVGCVLPELS